MKMSKVRYFEPGTAVWAHTDGPGRGWGRERAVVDARQGGVYRVRFESDQRVELRESNDVTLRVHT